MVDFHKIIGAIQETQIKHLYSISDFRTDGDNQGTQILPTKSRGLYWLWYRGDLATATFDEAKNKEVPIKELVSQRKDFVNICKIIKEGYTIVYNGMGGYKEKYSSYGLRGRINQELNCNDHRTGTLNIMNRGFNKGDWAVSFFDFDDKENREIIKLLASEEPYKEHANTLEILWRLEYGTPVLCRY